MVICFFFQCGWIDSFRICGNVGHFASLFIYFPKLFSFIWCDCRASLIPYLRDTWSRSPPCPPRSTWGFHLPTAIFHTQPLAAMTTTMPAPCPCSARRPLDASAGGAKQAALDRRRWVQGCGGQKVVHNLFLTSYVVPFWKQRDYPTSVEEFKSIKEQITHKRFKSQRRISKFSIAMDLRPSSIQSSVRF